MKRMHRVPFKAVLALLSGASLLVLSLWLIAAPPAAGQGPPSSLPVFQLIPPPVNTDNVASMANMFDQIGGRNPFTETTRLGTLRYTVGNTATGAIFERYGATGGLFAYNSQVAFGDGSVRGSLDPGQARQLACDFLTWNQLFPNEATFIDCAVGGSNLPYPVIVANSTVLTPAGGSGGQAVGGTSTTEQIALIVQVPLAISTHSGGDIPLRGPGGHLSVLVVSTDPSDPITPVLDSNFPGVAALAEPWYGRQLQSLGNFPVLPAVQAVQMAAEILSQQLPEGAQVNPGSPELVYWVEEPAAEQPNLLPEWYFPNATAVVDGQTVNMRGIHFPAVQGFNPTVQITQPANNNTFVPGEPVNFVGTISGGNGGPPYDYQWLLDDGTVLGSGTSNTSGGSVSLSTSNLPFALHNGEPALVTVRLMATDQNGATASAAVTLRPSVLYAYVPLVLRTGGGTGQAQNSEVPAAAPPYKVLAEYVHLYNEIASDLPGTVPDATGFYNGLGNYGWSKTFLWSNNLAWEKDWRDCSLGGGDCSYGADIADFAYFAGHGSVARIYFGVQKDSYSFYGGNARFNNVRWVGFSSCNTIRGTDISHWFNAFKGAHMLLGFHSVMADIAFGGPLVENMRIPKLFGVIEIPQWQLTIREAWVKTAFDLNAGRPAYIYAVGTNGVNPVNNKLPKGGDPALPRPFPVASWHWVWWSLPGD